MDNIEPRYGMVLWGNPPHDAVSLGPKLIDVLDWCTNRTQEWQVADRRPKQLPRSSEEWTSLVTQHRSKTGRIYVGFQAKSRISAWFELDVSKKVRDFDVLCIDMRSEHLHGIAQILPFDNLLAAFQALVRLFRPFLAQVNDRESPRSAEYQPLRFQVDKTKVPTLQSWISYYDTAFVERLGGLEKLRRAPVSQVIEVDDPTGVILVLQRETFDFHNPTHRARMEAVHEYLDLPAIHAKYPYVRPEPTPDRGDPVQDTPSQPSLRLKLKYQCIPRNAARFADDIVLGAAAFSGIDLDYTPASLSRVESILDELRNSGVTTHDIGETLLGFGCYLGEIMVRHAGASWGLPNRLDLPPDVLNAGWMLVTLPHGAVCDPIGKVFKRFETGAVENLTHFYDVLAKG